MTSYVIQQLINGLMLGSLYALVAIGFSLIYGVIRLVNFAHGDLMMIGAFGTFAIVLSNTVPWLFIPFFVLLLGMIIGVIIERLAFRSIRGAPMITGFIITLSLSIMIQNLGVMILGGQPRSFSFPAIFSQRIQVEGISIALIDIIIPITTLILAVLLLLLINKTKTGIAMKAVSENIVAAQLVGISINKMVMFTFAIGGALACLSGFFWGGKFGQIDPLMGTLPGLKAFVATIIGGVGSIGGAIAGGYILGLAEILFVGFLPIEYAAYRDSFVFLSLILILIIRPNGLFGKNEDERA